MTVPGIGRLLGADEGLNHQIADTFATIAQTDISWTEKIWTSLFKTDGSLQVSLGVGRYHNRGVFDGFGGVARGREQWTVRGSRALASAPEAASVGPISYEIIEPLSKVRVILEPNDVQPISFDLTLEGVLPPFCEARNHTRDSVGRIETDVVRYHQGGRVSGTLTIEGKTHEVRPDEWFGFRDHSWGVRQAVGVEPPDLAPKMKALTVGIPSVMHWVPLSLQRPDGSCYESAFFYFGMSEYDLTFFSAFINEADGRQDPVRSIQSHMGYSNETRYLEAGEIHMEMGSGVTRVLQVEPIGDIGFFLRTAGYGAWKEAVHGAWRGELELDGEYIADCFSDEMRPQLGQFRDRPVRVREGDAVGYGIFESIITGAWPKYGLTAESDLPQGF
jgi:hypothetical protein